MEGARVTYPVDADKLLAFIALMAASRAYLTGDAEHARAYALQQVRWYVEALEPEPAVTFADIERGVA